MAIANGTDRYARHRAIAGFSQQALADSRIVVVGAGAIGNEVVKNLVLLGVGRIELIDLDTVEIHNLTRSVLLRESDLGHPKAAAVARHAASLDPAVTITPRVGDVRDLLTVSQLRGATALIAALDNFEARIRVNQLCWLAGVAWINAAIDSRHATVEAFPFDASATSACYECGLPASVYRRLAERSSCGGLARVARAERIMPTTIITTALAAARAVQLALQPLLAASAAAAATGATRWLIDSQTGLASLSRLSSNPDCPGCAALPRGVRTVTSDRSPAQILAAARAALVAADVADVAAAGIRFADPIVWRLRCRRCGPTDDTLAAELQPARRVSERLTHCDGCGESTVAVEIRDIVDLDDLADRFDEWARDHAERSDSGSSAGANPNRAVLALPWLLAGDTCIELAAIPVAAATPPSSVALEHARCPNAN